MDPSSKKLMSHVKDIAAAFSAYYEALYDSTEKSDKKEKIKNLQGKIKVWFVTRYGDVFVEIN